MNCPTEKEIRAAANTSREARKALEMLFPDVFATQLRPGQLYSWGTGGAGVVVAGMGWSLEFMSLFTGEILLRDIPADATSTDLKQLLGTERGAPAEIRGPETINSWTTKRG